MKKEFKGNNKYLNKVLEDVKEFLLSDWKIDILNKEVDLDTSVNTDKLMVSDIIWEYLADYLIYDDDLWEYAKQLYNEGYSVLTYIQELEDDSLVNVNFVLTEYVLDFINDYKR